MTVHRELIRTKIKQLRHSQSAENIKNNSLKIHEKLFSTEQLSHSKCIAFYSSLDKEVSTSTMINKALDLGKIVCLPKINSKEKNMMFHNILSTTSLEKNNFGILEPTNDEICTNIDFIIVPGIVFDQSGNRIGFGYGYYDNFLNSTNIKYKIALAFDFQIVDKIDKLEHDIPMDMIITENRIIKIN